MAAPLRSAYRRGYPVREVLEVVEFWVDELDCLRGLEPVSPQGQMQQEHPHPVAWQWPSFHSCSKGELQRKCTKAVMLSSPGKYLLKGGICLLNHLCLPPLMPSGLFDPLIVISLSQLLCFLDQTHIPTELWLDWHLVEA